MNVVVRRRKVFLVMICAIALIVTALGIVRNYAQKQQAKISELSFTDCLNYTLRGESDGIITVGVIHDGQCSFTVYGTDGQVLDSVVHTYEIGSLTKTLTASMVYRAVQEGKLSLDVSIDHFLPVPEKAHYPTIRDLLTHTSGYHEYYFESEMIGSFFSGRNSFFGIGDDKVLNRIGKTTVKDEAHGFRYSNFGYATLGLILENVYGKEYTSLMNDYLLEMGFQNSCISDGAGDLNNYWDWKTGDTYMAAGAVLSIIDDMLVYAEIVLNGENGFDECTKELKSLDATPAQYEVLNIRMDGIGYGWIIDNKNGVIWHNGGTGNYNSYLGVNREAGTAVVVLSNLSPSKKIPATVLGIKLLLEISPE